MSDVVDECAGLGVGAAEAAAGGAIALVKTGDFVSLDVPGRALRLEVEDSELARRRAEWKAKELPERGWLRLYVKHVMSASEGADLDFLVGGSGSAVARDNH